ncbi:hypothetical protein [Enterobacter sp.]|uniref:hypothetical protein n=1 Tax=Enterobacter sp. TaxID=42895 RepID=UPI00296EE106|nr:hypothetical protein [Enterobacter sp.]
MPEYCFYQKGKHIVVLERSDARGALQLSELRYEKQFEEVRAADKNHALDRFADIRREKEIDQHNFISGAATVPFIGLMTAAATKLFCKK